MKQVEVYTDGACSGNPGPGGWGAILKYGAHERELSGGEAQRVNWPTSLPAAIPAKPSIFWTSLPPACTLPMCTAWSRCWISWPMRATP